jgi:hypothetical protein
MWEAIMALENINFDENGDLLFPDSDDKNLESSFINMYQLPSHTSYTTDVDLIISDHMIVDPFSTTTQEKGKS